MHRRSILAMLTGGAASAATGISPKEVAKTLGVEGALTVGGPMPDEAIAGVMGQTSVAPKSAREFSRAMSRVYRAAERSNYAPTNMPPHISTKRSWSAVFKQSVHERETELMYAYLQKMEDDQDFARQTMSRLGIAPPF